MIEVLAVKTARCIIHFPTDELNPKGRAVVPEVTDALIERYRFMSYPQKPDDYDWQKGISFEDGRWKDIAINRLTLFDTGVLVDAASSTDDSEAVLKDAIDWAADTFDFASRSEWFNRTVYLSELIIKRDKPLTAVNPAFEAFAAKLSKRISEIMDLTLPYEVAGISFGFDPFLTKHSLAGFRIERLAEMRYSDNRYHATANLPTKEHVEFLTEFEAALS